MLGPTNIPFDQVGAIECGTTISSTAAAAQSHTVTAGKKAVIFQIVSGSLCWFGGSTVNPATNVGIILLPRTLLVFRNVKKTFKIYFKNVGAQTSEIGINEMD